MPRQTADVIALIFGAVVGLVVVATTFSVLYIKITHPEQDTTPATTVIAQLVGVLVAALVGYMAGRNVNG